MNFFFNTFLLYFFFLDDVDAIAMTLADMKTRDLHDPCLSYVNHHYFLII